MQRQGFQIPKGGNNQFWDYSNALDSALVPQRFVTSVLDPLFIPFDFPNATGAYGKLCFWPISGDRQFSI